MTTQFEENDDKPMTAEEQEEMDAMLAELTDGGVRVIWLSSDEEAPGGIKPSFEEMATEFAAEPREKSAVFEVGDMVVTLNPFTGDILMYESEPEDMPRFFEVLEVEWDKIDETFRYRLSELNGRWIAEGWLDVPDLPIMAKVKLTPGFAPQRPKLSTSEVDELTTEFVSNSYLDMMNSTDEVTHKTGLEGLKAMAAEGVI